MKFFILAALLVLPLSSFANDLSFKACDLKNPNTTATVTVRFDKSGQEMIDLDAQNFAVDAKLLTSTKNMMVAMKIQIAKDELSQEMVQFYDLAGVKNIVSEMEYAALPYQAEGPAAFMINVITQDQGAMGLNIGIQAGGGAQVDTGAEIELAFVGSTLNCK